MIVFENDGLIDLDAIRVMGVSVKEGSNPFGKFGTGVKYGLSVFIREGCEVTLFRDGERIDFGKVEKTIRGQPFDVITMGQEVKGKPVIEELAFTTQLGKEWETWQAYREFFCNCRDEGGETTFRDNGKWTESSKGKTVFIIRGQAADKVWMEQGTIILRTKPTDIANGVEIHMGESEYVYYRGVRVHKLKTKSNYTYNVLAEMDLTEDRTLKYSWQAEGHIARAVAQSTWSDYLVDTLQTDKGFEASIDFKDNVHGQPSKQFMDAAIDLRRDKKLNKAASLLFSKFIERTKTLDEFRYAELNGMHLKTIADAKARLREKGVDFDKIPLRFEQPRSEDVPSISGNGNTTYVDIRHVDRGEEHLALQLLIAYADIKGYKEARSQIQLAHYILHGRWAERDSDALNQGRPLEEMDMPF